MRRRWDKLLPNGMTTTSFTSGSFLSTSLRSYLKANTSSGENEAAYLENRWRNKDTLRTHGFILYLQEELG